MAERKRRLRAALLAARRARPAAERRAAAAALRAALRRTVLADLAGPGAGAGSRPLVAGYQPMPTEPGGAELPDLLAAAAGGADRVLLPVLREDSDLDWVRYGDPDRTRLAPEAVREATLLVVPAVAVDLRGIRLGRGGGSFDRVLARVVPGTPVVALLFDEELLADPLPAAPHDRPVTAVLTPGRGLLTLPSRPTRPG